MLNLALLNLTLTWANSTTLYLGKTMRRYTSPSL